MTPSESSPTVPVEPLVRSGAELISSQPPLAALRSEGDKGAAVERIFDDPRGRPALAVSDANTAEMLQRIRSGLTLAEAASASRVSAPRIVRLLSEDESFRSVLFALLDRPARAAA